MDVMMNAIARTELNNYKKIHFPTKREEIQNAIKEAVMTSETQEDFRTLPRNPRLTLEQKNLILEHYKDGLNGVEIAELTQIPHHQITTYLKKVKTRRGGVAAEQKQLTHIASKPAKKPSNYSAYGRMGGAKKHLSQEEIDKIVNTWKAGNLTKTEIAHKFGVHITTVTYHVGRAEKGLPTTTKSYSAGSNKKEQTVAPTKPSSTRSLIEELKAEIRAELKAELLREMLGKK